MTSRTDAFLAFFGSSLAAHTFNSYWNGTRKEAWVRAEDGGFSAAFSHTAFFSDFLNCRKDGLCG